MRIKQFSNWLTDTQWKLIDQKEKQNISQEVKSRRSLKHLLQYMKAALIAYIKEDWRYEFLVQ